MSFKILITGPPRCGKSTLTRKLINNLQEDHTLFGFLTPEVRMEGKRIGFDLKDIHSGDTVPLARKGEYDSSYTLGSYKVFIDEFNHFLEEIKSNLLSDKKNPKQSNSSILIIDEIGKMELFSEVFRAWLKEVFSSDLSVIGTIGKHMNHPIRDFILSNPEVELFHLTRQNQEEIFRNILKLVNK